MDNIIKEGENTIKAHLGHLKEHNQQGYLKEALAYLKEKGIENPLGDTFYEDNNKHQDASGECPGTKTIDFRNIN